MGMSCGSGQIISTRSRVADTNYKRAVRMRRKGSVEIAAAVAQPISVAVKTEQRRYYQIGRDTSGGPAPGFPTHLTASGRLASNANSRGCPCETTTGKQKYKSAPRACPRKQVGLILDWPVKSDPGRLGRLQRSSSSRAWRAWLHDTVRRSSPFVQHTAPHALSTATLPHPSCPIQKARESRRRGEFGDRVAIEDIEERYPRLLQRIAAEAGAMRQVPPSRQVTSAKSSVRRTTTPTLMAAAVSPAGCRPRDHEWSQYCWQCRVDELLCLDAPPKYR